MRVPQFLMACMGKKEFAQWVDGKDYEDMCVEAARIRTERARRDVNPYDQRITTNQLDKSWLERETNVTHN